MLRSWGGGGGAGEGEEGGERVGLLDEEVRLFFHEKDGGVFFGGVEEVRDFHGGDGGEAFEDEGLEGA